MAQNVGNTRQTGRPQNIPNQGPRAAENQFTTLVAEKIEDGKLAPEAIKTLSDEVTKLQHPRERAHAKNALRAAIREDPDLSPAERRQAITELNKTMAQTRPAWATKETQDVAGSTPNAAEKAAAERTVGDTTETGGTTPLINPELNRVRNAPLLLANMPLRA